MMFKKSTNEYCNENFLDIDSGFREYTEKLSNEQIDTIYAMRELSCFHKDQYGKGDTFTLSTQQTEYEITIGSIIGKGGSKKATLLDNEKVAMLPAGHFTGLASWWPETVTEEAKMAEFLETIDIPALNREKAYITIPSTDNPGASYKLPVLLSDSFAEYASKGWYVFDNKNSDSNIYSDNECGHWNTELKTWEAPIKTLVADLWKLSVNGVNIGTDSRNLVLIEKEANNFELRFFGFDFGGKYGSTTVPSTSMDLPTATTEQICDAISGNLKQQVKNFIFGRLAHETDHCPGKRITNPVLYKFSASADEHFSSCDFIGEAISSYEDNSSEL